VWRPEASPRRIWHRFCTCRTPRTQLRARAGNRGAVQESYARRERAGATCAYNSRSDASEGRGFRMRGRERVAGQRHLEFAAAARCSDPVMPAPQSRDSSPYSSNRSAPSSSLRQIPVDSLHSIQELLVLHIRAHLCLPASTPTTTVSQTHKYLFLSRSFALLRCLCFCLSSSVSACAWFSTVNLHATWNKLTRATGKRRITSTCAPILEAKIYASVYVCAVPF